MAEGGTETVAVPREELSDLPEPWPTNNSNGQVASEPIESLHSLTILNSSAQNLDQPEPPVAEPADPAIVVPKGGQPQTCPLCKKLLLGGGKVVRKHLRRVHRANVVSARPGPPRPRRNSSGALLKRRGEPFIYNSSSAVSHKSVRESLTELLKEQTGEDMNGNTVLPEEWIGHTVRGVIHSKFSHGYFVTITVGSEKLSGILYHPPEAGVQGTSALRLLKDGQGTDRDSGEKELKRQKKTHVAPVLNGGGRSGYDPKAAEVAGNNEEMRMDTDGGREVGGGKGKNEGRMGTAEQEGEGERDDDDEEFDDDDMNMIDEDDDAEDEALHHMDPLSAESAEAGRRRPLVLMSPPPKPKRTSFNFYYTEWRTRLKAKHPHSPEADISKMIGEQWRKLTPEEKQPYVGLWKQDRDRWQAEQLAYNAYRLQLAFS